MVVVATLFLFCLGFNLARKRKLLLWRKDKGCSVSFCCERRSLGFEWFIMVERKVVMKHFRVYLFIYFNFELFNIT